MKLRTNLCLLLTLGLLPFASLAQTEDPYQALIKRDFGTATAEMNAITKEIQVAKPDVYPQIEAKLIAVVDSAEATMAGKQFACQQLKLVGSAKCIPALSKLLSDEKLSHIARTVLEAIKDPAAAEALRNGLSKTQGNLRIGIINSLGDCRDAKAVSTLGAYFSGNDAVTAKAALNAVAKIGGSEAAALLEKNKLSGELKDEWAHAYLRCAESLDAAAAEKIYQQLFDGDYALSVRAAALPGLARVQPERAVPVVIKTLSAKETMLSRAAAGVILNVPGNGITRAFAKELGNLPVEGKISLLNALAARGDAEGLTETVNKLAADQNADLRKAAIKALSRLGDASSIPVLLAALKSEPDAVRSMQELKGAGVTEAIIKQTDASDVVVREAAFTVLSERKQVEALPAFRKGIKDSEAKIRTVALKTISAIGTQEDLKPLLDALIAANESDRDQVAEAVSEIVAKSDKATRAEPVLAAFAKADAGAKIALLPVLPTIGGDKALEATRSCLSAGAEAKKAAVSALSEWPDASALADLQKLAKDDSNKSDQIVALQAYIKVIALVKDNAAKVAAYKEALGLASRTQEKFSVFSGLSDMDVPEALKLVETCLDDQAVQREAYDTYERIAEALPSAQSAVAAEALKRVAEKAPDEGLKNKAQKALEKMKQP